VQDHVKLPDVAEDFTPKKEDDDQWDPSVYALIAKLEAARKNA
jgi:hypothetical protein